VDPLVADGAIALALLLVSSWGLLTPGLLSAVLPALPSPPPSPGLIPLTALMIAPVVVRRRWPLTAFALQVAAWTLAALLSNRLGITVGAVAALLVVAYSAGAYSAHRAASLATVAVGSLLLDVGPAVVSPERFWRFLNPTSESNLLTVVLTTLLLVTAWLSGNAMRARRRHVAELEDRAVRMQRERESSLRAALAEERAHIARELHDVVAHGVSVMIIQAEAARRLLTCSPARAAEALQTVSMTGSDALGELQHLLRVLDAGDGQAELEPAPTLSTLERLLARMRSTGVEVELHRAGRPRPLPRGLELTAYRVVQEALTNVLKHGGGARAEVHLDYGPDCLRVEVVDDGHAAPLAVGERGRGLLGMRERMAAYGGELETGPRPEGGYAVRAWLPLGERE
jgi:signal transduction histidine kinase